MTLTPETLGRLEQLRNGEDEQAFVEAITNAAPALLSAARRERDLREAAELALLHVGNGANVPCGTWEFCMKVRIKLEAALAGKDGGK